ncbi:S8 family serine peptidase [Streptomyces sp. NPDC088551]|uniref:S8 family serine peptidase n=1 Tax=unclassified Streptomyces TaxID=2593676 RepID=UPI00339E42B9
MTSLFSRTFRRMTGRRRPTVAARYDTGMRALAVVLVLTAGLTGQGSSAYAAGARDRQWYLDRMNVDQIWKKTTGEGIKIAVIDSGVNPSTPSLKGQVLPGGDASVPEGGPDSADRDGRGTTTAELIAGTGAGGGIQGLAPGAKIIPIRVPPLEHDELPSIDDHVDRAIRMALERDAKIISISIGSEYVIGSGMTGQRYALRDALAKEVLVFAGTGDNAKEGNKPLAPARFSEVVGVASFDENSRVADFSQHGEDVTLAAPGVNIPRWCDATFRRYCPDGGGAHAASALASASAALIWAQHPDWTAAQVLRVMLDTAGRSDDWKPGTVSNYLGYGVIRPGAHINRGLGDPGPADRNEMPENVEPVGYRSTSPSPKPPKTPKPSPTHTAAADDSPPNVPVLIGGGAAAVLVVTAVAVWVARRRRHAG